MKEYFLKKYQITTKGVRCFSHLVSANLRGFSPTYQDCSSIQENIFTMPVTKMTLLRYQTIDQCLTNPYRIWQEADLLQALSHAHREHTGLTKGISRSTLFTDFKAMKPGGATGYEAPIAHTKGKGYHYTKPGYSISQSPVSVPDVAVLHQALLALQAIRGVGLATALDDIIGG
jgi:hypothetical protein